MLSGFEKNPAAGPHYSTYHLIEYETAPVFRRREAPDASTIESLLSGWMAPMTLYPKYPIATGRPATAHHSHLRC